MGEVVPFTTTSSGVDPSLFPELIDQFGYVYQSSQRPGARVHESLAEGHNPLAYWRYGSTYGKQVGIEGDLPNDIKWQSGGVVFRDENRISMNMRCTVLSGYCSPMMIPWVPG